MLRTYYRGPNVLVLVLVLVLDLVLHISLKILEKVLQRQFQDPIVDHSSKCHIDRLVPIFTVGHADECLKLTELKNWKKKNLDRFRLSTVILDSKHLCLFVHTMHGQGDFRNTFYFENCKKSVD